MNVAEWLARSGQKYPGHPALFSGERQLSDYQGFARSAAAIGAGLRDHHGVRPGDRVAIFAKNSPAYLEAMFGAWFAGAAIVPINAKLHAKEAAYIIANSGASVVFCSAPLGAELTGALEQPVPALIDLAGAEFEALRRSQPLVAPMARDGADMAWLFYTSGTTGRPKGVMISHANMQAMVFSYLADVDAVHSTDAALYAAPLSHGAGLYCLQHVLKAARHVVPVTGGFEPDEIFALARSLGDIHIFAAPTMVKRLVAAARERGEAGEGIRTIVYGGGPMYLADIVEAVEVLGPRFCQIYGQGESPMTITALDRASVADRAHPRWRERLASVGTAQSSVEVRIVDEAGNVMATGKTGEIVVRGAPVMSGYWRDREASAAALRDGWLWTGDMGALDADGFLTLKDRSKDVIISGGTNIYPREVEEALLTHPGVREASVIGVPDAEWGETILAFVVTDAETSPEAAELDQHCLASIARFKRPKAYRFVTELPKNNYGKVLKTELRRLYAAEQGGS
ncbi:class I adenylate-forming enzyme family protein [Hoeflea ulvae]|uniref:AMP-binding protein n=1 Tax=Hoeflea ulvae TaxID=2983764 RepID=A0ABT3YID9_9HYPH|nr:AMP-binding protein [Hoeflea ulvae]MCY0095656.1 AMP-binding protein [Hoeflea ulvae]